mgnify:CR=1 FL=1
MGSFSNLILEVKVNGKELNPESINKILCKKKQLNEMSTKIYYKIETESHSFIQIILKAKGDCIFFCRNNIIEYFLGDNKISEFLISPDQLESINLVEKNRVIINLLGVDCSIIEENNPENFQLQTLKYPIEKVWNTHRDIRYHFIEAKESTLNNQLIVVFAGMGMPFVYKYNYSKALSDINCHKLFIIDDYGDRGSYYLGNNLDSLVETSVISLILNIASRYNIAMQNILSMGSSKGGYAALYYGIKYSFGKVLAAAPQTLLGNFLEGFTLDMVKDITGNKESADVALLNQKLFSLLEGNRNYPHIHLMVGSIDPHLQEHLQPFIVKLREQKVPYEFEVVEGHDHNAIALFQNYFTQKANFLILNRNAVMYVNDIYLTQENSGILKCHVNCEQADKLDFAYYWYKNKQVIDKQFYVKGKVDSQITPDKTDGAYDVIVFVRYNNSIIKLVTETLVI